MQKDLEDLSKKAVKAALSQDWNTAKEINLQILDQDPQNIDAKTRLGKAYLELKEYQKARKCFKEVLAVDPINAVAKKNLELAKDEKRSPTVNGKIINMVQEPATSLCTSAEITAKGITASKLAMGTDLEIRVFSHMAKLYCYYKDEKIELGVLKDPKVIKKLKEGKDMGATFSGTYVKGLDKEITVLITSSLPIFEGERQELKPYIKRDLVDGEGELEPSLEETQN